MFPVVGAAVVVVVIVLVVLILTRPPRGSITVECSECGDSKTFPGPLEAEAAGWDFSGFGGTVCPTCSIGAPDVRG